METPKRTVLQQKLLEIFGTSPPEGSPEFWLELDTSPLPETPPPPSPVPPIITPLARTPLPVTPGRWLPIPPPPEVATGPAAQPSSMMVRIPWTSLRPSHWPKHRRCRLALRTPTGLQWVTLPGQQPMHPRLSQPTGDTTEGITRL